MSKNNENTSYFQKINQKQEIEDIFKKTIALEKKILIKILDHNEQKTFLITPKSLFKSNDYFQLYVEIPREIKAILNKEKNILGILNFENNKIVFMGKILEIFDGWVTRIQNHVFRVQRRQHFRFRFPPNELYQVEFLDKNSTYKGIHQLIDISAGGISVKILNENQFNSIKEGDEVQLKLLIPMENFESIWGRIIRKIQSQQVIGIKFLFTDKEQERDMIGYTISLYKKIFLK